MACFTSLTPHISRMLCMLNWGIPTSTHSIPSLAERMGPMVVPQGASFLVMNSWNGTEAVLQTRLIRAEERRLVAYLLFELYFITNPLSINGLCNLIMHVRVVGMDGVCHVCAYQQTACNRLPGNWIPHWGRFRSLSDSCQSWFFLVKHPRRTLFA